MAVINALNLSSSHRIQNQIVKLSHIYTNELGVVYYSHYYNCYYGLIAVTDFGKTQRIRVDRRHVVTHNLSQRIRVRWYIMNHLWLCY